MQKKYKQVIYDMLDQIDDEKILCKIYSFIKILIKK